MIILQPKKSITFSSHFWIPYWKEKHFWWLAIGNVTVQLSNVYHIIILIVWFLNSKNVVLAFTKFTVGNYIVTHLEICLCLNYIY